MPVVDAGSGWSASAFSRLAELAGALLARRSRPSCDERDARRSRSRGTPAAAAPRSRRPAACCGRRTRRFHTWPRTLPAAPAPRPRPRRLPQSRHVCRTAGGAAQGCRGASRRVRPVRRARPRRLGRARRRHRAAAARAEEIDRVRGLGDELDLDEVQQVYLPLSRLLSLYVERAGAPAPRAGGVPAPAAAAAHAVRDRPRRLGRGRQVDDRPRAAADARALARAPLRSRWSPPTASSTPTPSSSAAGCCTARASRSPTTARRCCAS